LLKKVIHFSSDVFEGLGVVDLENLKELVQNIRDYVFVGANA
jgi:hypothetical protein